MILYRTMCDSHLKVEPITPKLHLPKGPHWDENTQTLYFVDMFKGTIHSYNPASDVFKTAIVGERNNCSSG